MFLEKQLMLRKGIKTRFNQEKENEYMIDFKIRSVLIKCTFLILIIIYFEIEKKFPNKQYNKVFRAKSSNKLIKGKSSENIIKDGTLNNTAIDRHYNKTMKRNNSTQKIKACLCVVGKKENLYAKEYVNYYIKLGYEHVYIYDNNDVNDEKFEEVLQKELKLKYVTIINIRGKLQGQCIAYLDCYEKHSKEYDWLSFFDFDEFLDIKDKNIKEFLGNPRYDECVNIKINFLFYSDNELLYYDNRTVQERFTTALYKHRNNAFIKSTVRGGLPENYWSSKCTPHTSITNVTNCDSSGKKIGFKAGYTKPNFAYAALKHYYTKSTEEYAIKSKRGSAYYFRKINWDLRRKNEKFNYYFIYNKKTKEKVALLKKLFDMK